MSKSIVFIGVGGQGIILATKILSNGLASAGYDVKTSEIHGASQRGGSVTTYLKYGEKVYSPVLGLGEADMIVAFEKAEALRALPYLKKGGKIIMDTREINPLAVQIGQEKYPSDAHEVLKKVIGDVKVVNAAQIAKELGEMRAQNMVLLGALVKELGLDDIDWKALVEQNVPEKSKELNLKAFAAGYAIE